MSEFKKSRFDWSLMGEADTYILASTFLEAVLRFYEDPANIERFEQWQRQQQTQLEELKD